MINVYDEDESNADLSNDNAKAEVVIPSSPAFSHNELKKYTMKNEAADSFNNSSAYDAN